jgi:hypothetical protein
MAAGVWPASVVFARIISSAFFLMAGASFFAIAAAFAVSVAVPFAVAAVRAFPVAVRVAVTVLSFSPATVPIPIPTITSFAVAMILARGAMTFRVTVVMVRTVCKRERRKRGEHDAGWLSVSRRCASRLAINRRGQGFSKLASWCGGMHHKWVVSR